MQRIWQEVLGRPEDQPLSVLADFFAAGGSSLQVFRITAALQKELLLDSVPPALIHTERTVRAVAAALTGAAADERDKPVAALTWEGSRRPLSYNQKKMWLLRYVSILAHVVTLRHA